MLKLEEKGDLWRARRLATELLAGADSEDREKARQFLERTGFPKKALVIGAGAGLLILAMIVLALFRG